MKRLAVILGLLMTLVPTSASAAPASTTKCAFTSPGGCIAIVGSGLSVTSTQAGEHRDDAGTFCAYWKVTLNGALIHQTDVKYCETWGGTIGTEYQWGPVWNDSGRTFHDGDLVCGWFTYWGSGNKGCATIQR